VSCLFGAAGVAQFAQLLPARAARGCGGPHGRCAVSQRRYFAAVFAGASLKCSKRISSNVMSTHGNGG
jgi:hypothetical protein